MNIVTSTAITTYIFPSALSLSAISTGLPVAESCARPTSPVNPNNDKSTHN
jgi:hypothetical protein